MATTIQIEKKVREELRNMGRKNQTYSDIIRELLKEKNKYSASPAGPTESRVL